MACTPQISGWKHQFWALFFGKNCVTAVSPNCCKVFPLPSCNTTQKESGISWDHGIVMDSAMVPCKDIWRCHTIYTTEWRPHDTSWKWNLCPQESPAVQSYQQTRVEAIQIPCPNAMTLTGACMDSQLRLVKSMFRWRKPWTYLWESAHKAEMGQSTTKERATYASPASPQWPLTFLILSIQNHLDHPLRLASG